MVGSAKRGDTFGALVQLVEKYGGRVSFLFGILLFGLAGAWFAAGTRWLDAYGPIAEWASGLLSALVFVQLILLTVTLRRRWAEYQFVRAHLQKIEDVNPLDDTFHNRVINIDAFRTPTLEWIDNKAFVDCKILGPAVILFGGDGSFEFSSFRDCELVIVRNGAPIRNAIAFRNPTLRNCTVYNMTILVPEAMKPAFEDFKGISWVTK